MKAPRTKSSLGLEPMREGEILELVTDAFTLAAGHQMRGHRCLMCSGLIGSRLIRIVTVIPVVAPDCSCGNIETGTFPICAGHDLPPSGQLADAALDRAFMCGKPRQRRT